MTKIAYSYVRFSTPQQQWGDSERRQSEMTRQYAEENGFLLDEVTAGVDRGVSGFTGANILDGALGDFIRLAQSGKILKGSALLVENPDRISRQKFATVYAQAYQPLLFAGIELHFLSIRDVLKPNHSFVDILRIGVEIDRSVSESVAKSERLTKAWGQKKHNSAPGICISNKMPGWIEGRVGEPMRVNEERAQTVRRIFEMAASGMGKRLIARRLNQEQVPTFGKAPHWIQSYIQKVLDNRSVLGEYQPFRGKPGRKGKGVNANGESLKRVPDGPARLDFFPSIVSAELFERVQRSKSARTMKIQKDGKEQITGRFPGQTGIVSNLFSGLVTDGNFNLPMHYEDKGKKARPHLATACKEVNGCRPNTILYKDFEQAFLTWLDALDWSAIIDVVDSSEIKKTEEEIADLNLSITRTEGQIQSILDLLISTKSVALKQRLAETEAGLASDKARKEEAEKRLAEAKAKHRDLLNKSIVYTALVGTKDVETRAKLREEIRRNVSRIDFWFYRDESTPKLVEDITNELFPFARVTFANDTERYVVMLENGFMTLSRKADYEPLRAALGA